MVVLIAIAAASASTGPLAVQSSPTPVTQVIAKYTVETPLETIVADPAGKAVLDRDLPGLTAHAMFDQFKSMSLKQLQPMSGGKITDEGLVKVSADLAGVK